MCDSIVHVYRYTVIFVVHSDISTTRLELFYILHRRLGFFTMFKSPVSVFLQLRRVFFCFFFSFSSNQPQSMLLSNRAGKIELGCCCCCCCCCFCCCYKILFFSQVNKLHCYFKSLKKKKKTWRYSWEKQEVQLVSFYQLTCIFFCLWWWNQYTTSTFRTTSGRYVPPRSCSSFLSSRKTWKSFFCLFVCFDVYH